MGHGEFHITHSQTKIGNLLWNRLLRWPSKGMLKRWQSRMQGSEGERVMLMKTSVDFNEVAEAHKTIDARLVNWARWSHNHQGSAASPMFRLYRSPETWAHDTASNPVDGIDAQKVQKGVGQLPTKHRLALSWCYIKRNNPAKAAASIGESLQGLRDVIASARQMLINRRV